MVTTKLVKKVQPLTGRKRPNVLQAILLTIDGLYQEIEGKQMSTSVQISHEDLVDVEVQ